MKELGYKLLRISLFIIFPMFLGLGPKGCSFLEYLFFHTCFNPHFNVEINDVSNWWYEPTNEYFDLYVADSGYFFIRARSNCDPVVYDGFVPGKPNLNGTVLGELLVGTIMVGDSGRIILLNSSQQMSDIFNPAGAYNLNAIAKLSIDVLIAVGDSGTIIRSSDSGLNWEIVNSPTTSNLTDVSVVESDKGDTVITITGENLAAFRTTDWGNSWAIIGIGKSRSPNEANTYNRVYFFDNNIGYIGGPPNFVGKTTDGGLNWTTLYCPGFNEITDFNFISPDSGVVVGTSGIARFTTDGGLSWAEDTAVTNLLNGRTVNAIYRGEGENSAVIVGESNMLIVMTPDSTLLSAGDEEIENPNDYNLSYNYPNPFNPTTKIQYTIPPAGNPLLGGARGGLITLKVYDILGNEVATLVNEEKTAGEYEVEFNAYGLPSGIYFYRLTAGEFTETKKLVLMK